MACCGDDAIEADAGADIAGAGGYAEAPRSVDRGSAAVFS
jgi:hypothetical protein